MATTKEQGRRIYAAQTELRRRHEGEYQQLLTKNPANYSSARHELCRMFPDEYAILRGQKPTHELPRRDMDALDALILLERHMTARQAADYDGCTRVAALRQMVPILAKRGLTVRQIAERLDVMGIEVARLLAAA